MKTTKKTLLKKTIPKKPCRLCGHTSTSGCRLVSSLCINSDSKPSFVEIGIQPDVKLLEVMPILRKKIVKENYDTYKTIYGSFASQARAIEASESKANPNQ